MKKTSGGILSSGVPVAIGVLLATTLMAGSVFAQSEKKAKDASSSGLEEVIVTATKKEESLQDVGMSITALSDVELEKMGAVKLLDFAVHVPNLGMAYEADGRFDSSSPSIRGIFGTNTTGFYIDDTPVNASILPRVMDVERIEVLRGPQGSLYGAKSMGGTIRIITKQPDLTEPEHKLHATLSAVKYGKENYNADGIFNIPLVPDVAAVRITGYYGHNSGIFDRVYIPQWTDSFGNVRQSPGPAFPRRKNVDDEKYYGGQLAGKIAFSDSVSLDLRLMSQKVEADGLPFADIKASNTTERRFFDLNEPGTDLWHIYSGTLHWDTSAGKLTSTTSWYDRKTSEWEEETTFLHWLFDNVIGIPIDPIASVINTTEKYDSFVQETRFTSNFDGKFNFIVGFFYQDLKWNHYYPPAVQTGLAAAIDAFTGVPGLGQNCDYGFCLTDNDLIFTDRTITKTEETAFFGELTYQISDRWSVTAGGRFYDNKVTATDAADGFANSGPSSYADKQSESGFNPKFLAEAVVNEDVNVYATAAKGFRIGGVNGNVPIGLCGPELDELGIDPSNATIYDSDNLWSYELGFKSTLADNRVTLNGAVYFIDWKNIQQLNRLACGFQFVQNAGKAESKGFELELQAAPVEGLSLSAAVGYTKAQITDDGGVPGVSKGDKIQGVPDWTLSGSAQYNWPAFGEWQGMVRADANYYGDSYSANNEASAATQRLRKAWSALNLRAGIVNEKWDLILFIKNVTDERANLADSRSIAAETPGRQRLVVNRPRTVGIEARMRF
jgi:outer membrane receptor protein involved in Fe transport